MNKAYQFNIHTVAERYYEPGGSLKKLGDAYNVNRKTIKAHLEKAGYPLRSFGPVLLEGRWSINGWRGCRSCRTTERPHKAKGFCTKCYRHFYFLVVEQGKIARFDDFNPRFASRDYGMSKCYCGKTFKKNTSTHRFCSTVCQRRKKNGQRRDVEKGSGGSSKGYVAGREN